MDSHYNTSVKLTNAARRARNTGLEHGCCQQHPNADARWGKTRLTLPGGHP